MYRTHVSLLFLLLHGEMHMYVELVLYSITLYYKTHPDMTVIVARTENPNNQAH